jgi:cysteinyl-tRNA synthetase
MTHRTSRQEEPEGSSGSTAKRPTLAIYNGLTKQSEQFATLVPRTVKMYTCGLTVNNLMHVGHARCYVFWDVVERYLRYLGYEVKHVSNVTDISVDDRILRRLRQTGESFQQLVIRHTRDYFDDRRRLGIADPLLYALATQHIHEMIELVQRLLDRGNAYLADDGVYFRLSSFPNYGRLSGMHPEALHASAGGRIAQDEYDKESVGDFALWKRAQPGEPYWYSPWGTGRPGWHIECSAMAMKYLGEQLDIAGGGEDNIFPHHENTIAQSEAATGKPFVRFWMHVRHMKLRGEKMSKSTGNFLTVRDACDKYGAAAVRLFLLSTHYRKPIDFNEAELAEAQHRLGQMQRAIVLLTAVQRAGLARNSDDSGLRDQLGEQEALYRVAMNDDFNTALVLSHLFRYVSQLLPRLEPAPMMGSEAAAEILAALRRMGTVIFGDLYEKEVVRPPSFQADKLVNLVLAERELLRANREYGQADVIRRKLREIGIEVTDTAAGPVWASQRLESAEAEDKVQDRRSTSRRAK